LQRMLALGNFDRDLQGRLQAGSSRWQNEEADRQVAFRRGS
jgi:hypothetical protein